MGTKNNPGQFDCYAKADPNEPMFTLLARDPYAPHIVRLWAKARRGDIFGGLDDFRALFNSAMTDWKDGDKERAADACAEEMEMYAHFTGERWNDADVAKMKARDA